ncbi:MAG: hypothetical protein H6745_10795 [Deltaproteobacteria bacterium]|nr:hypothetical protein [Deltaproteobacteria bacterium]
MLTAPLTALADDARFPVVGPPTPDEVAPVDFLVGPPAPDDAPFEALGLSWLDAAELDFVVPGIAQTGDVTNCGPTAAAMIVAAFRGVGDEGALLGLRDEIGRWSWDEFPLRRVSLPGYDAGMTTPGMLRAALDKFAAPAAFEPFEHPWIPSEAWSLLALTRYLEEGRPVLALVQASTLWNARTPSLHWIVLRGLDGGDVIYNDPADGTRSTVPLPRFWAAWRLNDLYRHLPMVSAFAGLVPTTSLAERSYAMDAPTAGAVLAK